MVAETVYERFAQRQVSAGIVVGVLLVFVIVVITVLAQYRGVVNIFSNLTETWLFAIALPLLSIAFTLIMRGLSTSTSDKAEKDALYRLRNFVFVMPSQGLSLYPYLTLHLSHKEDTAEKPVPPYYIVNHKRKRAFWAHDFIVKLANQKFIQCITHNGEDALQKYLNEERIKLNQRYPTSYKKELDLDLSELANKLLG